MEGFPAQCGPRQTGEYADTTALRSKKAYETLFPFFLSTYASYPPSNPCEPSRLSIEPDGLDGDCELLTEVPPRPCPSLNICTVSCAELTTRSVDTRLKLSE